MTRTPQWLKKIALVITSQSISLRKNKLKERRYRGQQCIMICQEHNRSWEGMLHGKKRDLTSMTVPFKKNDTYHRTEINPQGIYVHYENPQPRIL